MATYEGRPVALRRGSVMALAFHPELSGDLRLHREFLKLVESARENGAGRKEASWGS